MNLAFPFAFPKASIKEPRCINQEGLFAETASVEIGGWVHRVVRVGFEAQ